MAFNSSVVSKLDSVAPSSSAEVLLHEIALHVTPVNLVCFLLGIGVLFQLYKPSKTNVIAEGYTNTLASYISAHYYIRNTRETLMQGYKKYKQATFKVPGMERWTTILNKTELIEEIRKAPDDKVSFQHAINELLVAKYTFGEQMTKSHYHTHVIQNQLTRSLPTKLADVIEEVQLAFSELVPEPSKDGDWTAIPALSLIQKVVCRASSRIFVGLPLCRNQEYSDFNIQYAVDIIENALFILKFPPFLRPIVGYWVSTSDRIARRALKYLGPVLEERMRMYDETGGDSSDKPVDMISWLLDAAPPDERNSVWNLTKRILVVNFAAIHTTSNSFTHALFHLASEPHYIEPLREEVQRVIKEDGWTKVAMTRMWKLDSFLKESQRINGINLLGLNRMVLSDLTLSDGTFLPKGSFVAANLVATHRDPSHYSFPEEFRPWRFSEVREQASEEALKHQMVNTSPEYLPFGHGRHACPGRFFAVNELKAMMCYIVMNYDIKAEVEGVRPPNVYKVTRMSPNPTAKVLFRKRTQGA